MWTEHLELPNAYKRINLSARMTACALAVLLLVTIPSVAGCRPDATSATTTPAHPGTSAVAGKLAWKFKAGDWAGGPAVSGALVNVVGNDGNKDEGFASTLHALDTASGAERWKYTMTSNWVSGSPAVSGDLVYVGGDDGYLYALDAASGRERWKQKTGLSMDSTSPVVSGGLVYVMGISADILDVTSDGGYYVCALDAASGTERWRFRSEASLVGSPVVSGGVVYATSVGDPTPREGESVVEDGPEPAASLYALDAASGTERWKFDILDASSPAVSGGLVYVGSLDGFLHALDASSGVERWKCSIEDGAGSPAVAAGTVYVGGADRYLYAVDSASGGQRWKIKTSDWVYSPAVSDGVVYVEEDDSSGDGGHLFALGADSGVQRWKFGADGLGDSSPAVAGGQVYVTSGEGYLYAVTTGTGEAVTTETGAPSTGK